MKILTKLGLAAAGLAALIGIASAKEGTPASISITAFDVNPKNCVGACTITATATWQNRGEQAGTFTPSFVIDGVKYEAHAPVTLGAGMTADYQTSVSVSSTGSPHSVCPYPNP